jgi:hypothetical protein
MVVKKKKNLFIKYTIEVTPIELVQKILTVYVNFNSKIFFLKIHIQ